jgi:hypothetical protein
MPSSIERASNRRALSYRSGSFIRPQKYEEKERLKVKGGRFRVFIAMPPKEIFAFHGITFYLMP